MLARATEKLAILIATQAGADAAQLCAKPSELLNYPSGDQHIGADDEGVSFFV
jgi:hypothetical protein